LFETLIDHPHAIIPQLEKVNAALHHGTPLAKRFFPDKPGTRETASRPQGIFFYG